MDDEKSLVKITNKYHCMATGQKIMVPCEGCVNPKGCLSRAMQYKETEEMDSMQEKAVLTVNADGSVASCAKGLDVAECGYKGGRVCGACGAAVTMGKGSGEPLSKPNRAYSGEMNDVLDEREMSDEEKRREYLGAKTAKRRKAGMGMMAPEEEDEEEMPEEEMPEDEEDEMAMGPGKGWMMKPSARSRRLAIKRTAGKKADLIEDIDDAFICQFERKVMSGADPVCANCPGGCAPESGMPGIADIEGMALSMFGGKVLASGYADDADLFVVDVMTKDGDAVEIIADGSSGELLNFHRLNTPDLDIPMSGKSLDSDASLAPKYVNIKTAQGYALSVIEDEIGTKGAVIQADSDIFEGFDSYVFEIDAMNGKSYDVFVGLDGTVLGYDEYDAVEAEEIEAEAAELALKRAYSEDERSGMAKRGHALPDGSFPIKDEEDLRNAIQAFGRAKDKNAAKAHIIKRAMDLGMEELIPMNWVPKKIQQQAAAGKKSDDTEFVKELMDFQLLAAEEELKDIL